jgi:hypothetical protein
VELERVMVPSLVNDLSTVSGPLVLVLDDYHVVTDATCHETLGLFLDQLPADVHVVLSTQLDPPLPPGPLAAGGERPFGRRAEREECSPRSVLALGGSDPSGKSLARPLHGSPWRGRRRHRSEACPHPTGTSGALLSSDDFGSSVEGTATLHPL